ncbi:hypothetical protein T11_9996 [Trichinella zimbabwensis]|uniref:Uncharacterized protein n=1 Tax=Trichinella zimbabwensis TaxID=268475 RepID=A0A0V1GC21_9BILA|nr:hypothetical protein T11_9996 [Trichinella zimbabwensis]
MHLIASSVKNQTTILFQWHVTVRSKQASHGQRT